ncbi:C1 family peptidase [Apilactobacillus sp. TMW 2.2459]|uniref:C1 family peptidase n=1 Tax=Apilactobacillus xinyiensis TaxID=2841032 RepID=UPI00200DA323|nr:C1 family peptidase [Apilactobacillus xinyiensis]MCL0312499.1 C1 family peptidase [Apilactobacillus xinyiensis]
MPNSELTKYNYDKMEKSFKKEKLHDIVSRTIVNNGIRNSAKDNHVNDRLSGSFSVELDTGKVSDQKASGRCWLFSLLNVLKHDFAKKYDVKDFELSQSYLFFWDKVERANIYYDRILETAQLPTDDRLLTEYLAYPGEDGGEWGMAVALVQKYGVMPTSAFPESNVTNNTRDLDEVLNLKLRRDGLTLRKMVHAKASDEEIKDTRKTMLAEIYRIAGYACGVPRETFDFEYRDDKKKYHLDKNLTPQQFYAKYFDVELDDYIQLSNYPDKAMNKLYNMSFADNVVGGPHVHFLNMPMEILKDAAIKQLKAGQAVWFGNDVATQSNSKEGLLDANLYHYDELFDVDLSMTKQERFKYHQAVPSHAMTLTGVDLVDDKSTKWKVENSWGEKVGEKGYFKMSDSWMDEYVYEVIVNKKYLSESNQKLLDQTPIELQPWE